jgi:hypothetical protein
MDQVVSLVLDTFPNEPWERGFSAYCTEPGLTTLEFSDSFGEIYGYQPTDDPCAVYYAPPTVYTAASAHKHPYITTAAEYQRGEGCGGPPVPPPPTPEQLVFWMQTSGAVFSAQDILNVIASGKRSYLRTSLGDRVLRRDYNGNQVQVYP